MARDVTGLPTYDHRRKWREIATLILCISTNLCFRFCHSYKGPLFGLANIYRKL